MNARDTLDELARAERAGDEAAADAALDRVLALAANAAAPGAERAQIDRALGAALGLELGGAGLAPAARAARSGLFRIASKLALVTIGVAIGFVWGRSPEWSTEPVVASIATPSGPAATPAVSPQLPASEPALASATLASAPAALEAAAPPARDAGSSARTPERSTPPPRAARAHSGTAPAGATADSRGAPRASRAPSEPGADTLRIALEQLRKAQLFLSASEPTRALLALDELDTRVPAAVLGEEREVTRALALCKTGDDAGAAALAARVLTRTPDSAYALSLRESCAGERLLIQQMREHTSNRTP